MDKFDSILSSVIDSHLGLRSTLIGYQYSEIIRAIFSVFCCGGDCMEDLNLYLKDVLTERPHTRVPSADTVLRGIEELATENISYTAEKPHSSEFAIRWCRVWGFAIPYICCGFHGKRIFFGGKYSSFFGKTRKKCVCVSTLQMLIFKAGGLQIRQS